MPTSCAIELGDNASIAGGSIDGDWNDRAADWDDWGDDDAWGSQKDPELAYPEVDGSLGGGGEPSPPRAAGGWDWDDDGLGTDSKAPRHREEA